MIKKFMSNLKDNNDVIIEYFDRKIVQKTKNDLYQDILKMISYYKSHNLKANDKVLVGVLPSRYDFYVLLFSGMIYNLNFVVLDNYKLKNINYVIKTFNINHIALDSKTILINPLLGKVNALNITKSKSCELSDMKIDPNLKSTVLSTFTSGTTANSKIIERSIEKLFSQLDEIGLEFDLNQLNNILGLLPIYNILSIYLGKKTFISKRLIGRNVEVILGSINQLLKLKRPMLNIKQLFIGGAILYKSQAERLKNIFPNAYITYVYGASEKAIIAKVNLNDYIKSCFAFGDIVKSAKLKIINPNTDGVGEIVVVSDNLNIESKEFHTNDIGKLTGNTLQVLGRKKYSNLEQKLYNYQLDQQILKENPKAKAFTFWFEDKFYVAYKGKLSKKQIEYTYIKFKKLPMDYKHKTKLNYPAVIKKLSKNNTPNQPLADADNLKHT